MQKQNITLVTKPTLQKLSKKGFTLFVAMIVSSLLLAVGFSIGNIILKQLILSGSSKDSQIAFYAADSGAECAQLWDEKGVDGETLLVDGPFATSTDIAASNIRCGAGIVGVSKLPDSTTATSTIVIEYTGSVNYYSVPQESYRACAKVTIEKGFDSISGEQIPYTKIMSRGYNAPAVKDSNGIPLRCDTTNARVLERGVFVQY